MRLLTLIFTVLTFSYGHYLQPSPKKVNQDPAKGIENDRSSVRSTENEFDQKILEMFRMKRLPNPGRVKVVPRLMQHLYRAHTGDSSEDESDVWEVGFNLPLKHVISRVNTARSFHHIDKDENLIGLQNHQVRLRFDLSRFPKDEEIRSAELLLHREAIAEHLYSDKKLLHRINVYEITKLPFRSSFDVNSKNSRQPVDVISRLIDTRLVDPRNTTWEKFDVSLAAFRWSNNHPDDNHGLVVELVEADVEKSLRKVTQKHVRIKRDFSMDLSDQEWLDKRPTLILYSTDGENTTLEPKLRSRRSSETNESLENNGSSRKRDLSSSRNRRKKKKKLRPCTRKDLYVDFHDVGWHEWIVAPSGYDAYYCQGQCHFPLAEHLNATNHAIVQTLANSVDSSAVPKPCCVPTKLSSISMLYVDEHEQVVLKSYPSMQVQSCGCR